MFPSPSRIVAMIADSRGVCNHAAGGKLLDAKDERCAELMSMSETEVTAGRGRVRESVKTGLARPESMAVCRLKARCTRRARSLSGVQADAQTIYP